MEFEATARSQPEKDCRHLVQFLADDANLGTEVAQFARAGLQAGEAVIVIASGDHRRAIYERFRESGSVTEEWLASGQFRLLDAQETLDRFVIDGKVDPVRFDAVIGTLIRDSAFRYPKVRAYGEMVDVLWRAGNLPGTLALEQLWADLGTQTSFTLLCGYRLSGFEGEDKVAPFDSICDAHHQIRPRLARLEQRQRSLAAEARQRRGAEERIARLVDKLQDTLRVRDVFLSVASHELRTPLTALKLQLALAWRTVGSEPGGGGLQRIVDRSLVQVSRLSRLIDQLLSVATAREGKLPLQKHRMDLGSLLRELGEQFELELEAAGCRLTLDLSPELSGVWDRSRLEQVFANLFSNVIKHAPGAAVAVRSFRSGETVVVAVQDSGPGVPEGQETMIFERFQRAGPKDEGGLGLGLYITREILDAHGGSIRVESRYGHGATFTVELPLT